MPNRLHPRPLCIRSGHHAYGGYRIVRVTQHRLEVRKAHGPHSFGATPLFAASKLDECLDWIDSITHIPNQGEQQ